MRKGKGIINGMAEVKSSWFYGLCMRRMDEGGAEWILNAGNKVKLVTSNKSAVSVSCDEDGHYINGVFLEREKK